MPFGYFNVVRAKPKSKPKPADAASSLQSASTSSTEEHMKRELNICLISRTQAQASQFLCAMNINMGEAMPRHGLAFYIPDLRTITTMSREKQKLLSFFRSFSQENWVFQTDEEERGVYIYDLSPAGVQKKAIELKIQCLTPDEGSIPANWDALWLLADGVSLTSQAADDGYTRRILEIMNGLPAANADVPRPVTLILTQFDGSGEDEVMRWGADPVTAWNNHVPGLENAESAVAMIPVQVYGGLTFAGRDAGGSPVLRLDKKFQTYRPKGCHIPVLYSLQAIFNGKADIFSGDLDGGLMGCIVSCYGDEFSNSGWRPVFLGVKQT